MLNKQIEKEMRNDAELQVLRKKVYAITGNLKDISFCIEGPYNLKQWKKHLRKIVEEHSTTSQ